MKTQHTPGPWQVKGGADIVAQRPDNSGLPLCIGQAFTPVHHGGQDDVNAKLANARLMAAAPELLAAIERCIPCLQAAIDELGSREDKACLAQVRKVINKARGA